MSAVEPFSLFSNKSIPCQHDDKNEEEPELKLSTPTPEAPDEKEHIEEEEILDHLSGETIMIVGGTGSLGNHLVQALRKRGKNIRLIVVSRDETKQYVMKLKYPDVHMWLGDMRDLQRMRDLLSLTKPTIVIIAAALKHIDQCEANVHENIATNINGTLNMVRACSESKSIRSVLFVSTDKATSPVNCYGLAKGLSERIVTNHEVGDSGQKYLVCRYGNVLNSRGSIIPKFVQLAKDDSITHFPVTDERMTRFFMPLDQSIDLIFNALVHGSHGETFVPRVHAATIMSLAEYFSKRFKKPVKIVGLRPGEKIHECLINETELARTTTRVIGSKRFHCIAASLDLTTKPNHDFKTEYNSSVVSEFSVLEPLIDEIITSSS